MMPWPAEQAFITALSFISFFLVSIPLYWHLEAWNVGCILYIIWIGMSSLIFGINGCIWRDNAIVYVPVWGDITTRIIYAEAHGIIAASLVINRRLYKIASTTSVSISRQQRRRAIYVDLGIGLGIPLVTMVLMWFVQGHRFNIYEGIGPLAAIPNTYFAMVLGNGVSILIGCISAFYCIGTLRAFMRRRRQFSELLASNNNMNFNRYFRLMALATLELLGTIPFSIYFLYRDTQYPIYVWRGLTDIHLGFSRIDQYPYLVWNATPGNKIGVTLSQYLTIACGIVFFLFFGLAEEARTHYRLAFTTVAKRLGISTGGATTSTSGWSPSKGSKLGATIPSFVQRSFVTAPAASHPGRQRKRDSFGLDSFVSDRLSTQLSLSGLEDLDDKTPYSPVDKSAGESSSSFASPVDGEKPPHHLVRPDSGVVVNIEVIPDSPRRQSVDVPMSVRDDSHIV
ncbi:fungal a-factor pheromone receptor STE3 [Phanerochaete sordida]|uniref:Fungal a-factor pheromone receptor STE3 n=1 Tax=Phanerochaete sordida TaxID=48140 RepID=A0A9P3FZT3_9APHY|nr:fungal a-factor pheromone receptor STE3 [Phanerochaete sordida]